MPRAPGPSYTSHLRGRGLEDLLEAKSALKRHHFGHGRRPPEHSWQVSHHIAESAQRAAYGMHSIGIGRKVTAGKAAKVTAVRIYVAQKLPRSRLSRKAMILPEINGIPTDVIEAPIAYFSAAQCTIARRRRQRPLIGGISAANEVVSAGTLGIACRSTLPDEGTARLMLSNCHVLADFGAAPIGSAVLQPAARDGGEDEDRIGRLLRFKAILAADLGDNLVDAAIVELNGDTTAESGICTIGSIDGVAAVGLQMRVHKHGRTTGLTLGVVDDVSVDALVPMSRDVNPALAQFVGQIRIVPAMANTVIALGGDSGAIVALRDRSKAVGLLFSCPDDGSYGLVNPMQAVLDALQITL